MKRTTLFVTTLAALTIASGCGRRPSAVPAASPTIAATPTTAGGTTESDAERARLAAEEARRRDEIARSRAVLATTVYFDFDSFTIREDSRRALDEKSPLLRADPSIRLRLSGHADDRGSTEYNLALGMRRAEAVKEYLSNFGVGTAQLEVISFGEERPVDAAANEAAWSRNRRVEFEITGGLAGQ